MYKPKQQKTVTLGCQDGTLAIYQGLQFESDSGDPQGGRRKQTPTSCP